MRVYCRPGATPVERLESYLAFLLASRPEASGEVADLLVRLAADGPAREAAIREAFASGPLADPAEALGVARAVLLLCGLATPCPRRLSGNPRRDLAGLMEGEHPCPDLAAPDAYAAPGLLEAYCFMGAGVSRGVDTVFRAISGRPLGDHLAHALSLLQPVARSA